MPDTLEYIESYFQQTLNSEERIAFETKCIADEAFAKEVAFYITARQALHETLLAQKAEQWKNENPQQEELIPVISIKKRSTFARWVMYAAAACLLLVASVYLFEVQKSPQKLANNYIRDNYAHLSITMNGDSDSITLGMAAYNQQDYNKALRLFEGVEQRDSSNSDAKKYTGLTYLKLQDYDKALQQFTELANMKLFSNPGDLLKAVTLLQRNQAGDKEAAKKLLQKVAKDNEEGNEEAEIWITKF